MKTNERTVGAPKSFRIRADNIPPQGLEIHEVLDIRLVNKLLEEPKSPLSWTSTSETTFDCQLEHEADMLHLKGGGVFKVMHPCVRCVEDVEFELTVTFNARLFPREQDPDFGRELDAEAFDDAVASALADDEETVASYYDDGIIDLSDLLREQLFLEFPLYPCCDSQEAKNPKECDLTVLQMANMTNANVIEHPFANLKDWKPKNA